MNIQAMMQQAQKLQKEMLNVKKEIEAKEYVSTQSFVTVSMKGTKQIKEIKIDADKLDKEDIEILQDILCVAINENIKKIDTEKDTKLGKFGNMSGLL